MRGYNRKTTPRVQSGRVHKKNNWAEAGNYYNTPQPFPSIYRKRPGQGFRHVLRQEDIETFVTLLPDWTELSRGLGAIVLAPGDGGTDGYYMSGVIHVQAWARDLWDWWSVQDYDAERTTLQRLGVQTERHDDQLLLKWTENQVRAYQLLRVFLHELGHHHDALISRPGARPNRGESYAEAYAERYEAVVWDRYLGTFPLV